MLLLLRVTSHDDVTHAYEGPNDPTYRVCFFWWPGVIWGHTGQILIFTKNSITPTANGRSWPNLVTITLTTTPTCHVTQRSVKGHLRSQRSKVQIPLKRFNSAMFRAIFMKLMHGDPLMTLHQKYAHEVGQRSFEVTGSKKLKNFNDIYFQT